MSAEHLHDTQESTRPAAAQQWLDHFRYLDEEQEGTQFTPQQEVALAGYIQQSQQLLDTEHSHEYSAEERDAIRLGEAARQALFTVNIPFALYCARESVGITHASSHAKLARLGFRRVTGRASGTYSPLSSLKSPHADLEHREQSALEGLWTATADFKAVIGVSGAPVRFTSYAAYDIQQRIDRDIQYEERGIRLKSSHSTLNEYFRDNPNGDREDLPPAIRRYLELTNEYIYDELAPVSVHEASVTADDDYAGELADIWADTREENDPERQAHFAMLRHDIEEILSHLSEREAGVIRYRYGLGDEGALTLDEIGDKYGVSRERIRQIESKTMAKLRHPSRSKHLKPYLDGIEEFSHLYTGDSIEARLPQLEYPEPIEQYEQREYSSKNKVRARQALESWQLSKGEKWEGPVRFERDRSMDDETFARIVTVLLNVSSWHFDKRTSLGKERPYSTALRARLDNLGGEMRMSPAQLEHVWAAFMSDVFPRIKEELGENMSGDQIGRFFSSLLAQHIDTSDMATRPITLTIPEHARKQVNYLASNLRQGVIHINGAAGDKVAAGNKGAVSVTVNGSAGDLAGFESSGYATLVVSGEVGYSAGRGMKDFASIEARTALSVSEDRDETTSVELDDSIYY